MSGPPTPDGNTIFNDPGSRLTAALADRYRLERELGAGGMATVYLAEDLRHHRKVAIKVVRPELAVAIGAERFVKEIELTANLRHPHILPLYDSGTLAGDGTTTVDRPYYVMPFVEGETLRDRLARDKQLPLDEALRIASQVADALGYAHSRGVVHRDIKPENILLEGRHAVVADFGIAKAMATAAQGATALTATGLTIGTPAYMSPEQAAGETQLDGRSDQYSLACVLYEMLAGQPPFAGPTAQAVIARRLTEPAPRLGTTREGTPRAVDQALAKALATSPAERYASAEEFLQALQADTHQPASPRADRRKLLGLATGLALAALLAWLLVGRRNQAPAEADLAGADGALPVRTLSQLTFRESVEEWPSWSPDGKRLVFAADVGGYKNLFVKTLAGGEDRQLTSGPQDDIQPDWSPDGRIAFVRASLPRGKLEPGDVLGSYSEGGDIWILDSEAGQPRRLIAKAFNPAFSADGARIAFDADWAGPRRIWVADSGGRNPVQVTTDSSEAVVHTSPRWSPDGSRIVFRRIQKTKSDVVVVDLATKATMYITDDNITDLNPVWSPSGRFIYFSSSRGGGLNVWRSPVTPAGAPDGGAQQLTTGAGGDLELAVAPDGHRLAFSVLGINSDIWRLLVDPSTGRATGEPQPVVATTRVESRGAWSPDGRMIAFNSDRLGDMTLWVHSLEDGSDRQVTTGPGGDYQPNWSPDGTRLAFFSARAGSNDIWTVTLDGQLRQLTRAPGTHTNPFYSPDGRRIAYHSDRDGRTEVWLMNADGSDQRRLTSVGVGGHFMRWSPDGQYILFRHLAPDGPRLARVSAETGAVEEVAAIPASAHMSFSPDRSLLMDAPGHKAVWVYPIETPAEGHQVFAFADPEIRIDYPVWSPDGRWVLFDRAATRGGDIWLLDGIE